MGPQHLYVHIPFCRARCAYCDFVSEPVGPHLRAGRVEGYLRALRSELEARGRAEDGGRVCFDTIYLGGGTPTVLPLDMLLELVGDLSTRLQGGGEYTVEANPGTLDSVLLTELAARGVTRLSLGVQSFSTALRTALGRSVTQKQVNQSLAAVTEVGWREWNLDLVLGIPGQSGPEVCADIEAAAAAGPPHVSVYDLTYTDSFRERAKSHLGVEALKAARRLAEEYYSEAVARLESAGYRRYEVSNFALPGHECRHNQAYWRGEDYLGVGAAAVSTRGGERRTNPLAVGDYLAGDLPSLETLSPTTRLWEKAMLGLRTSEGVEEAEVSPVLDTKALDRLLERGCLERRYGKLRVNPGFLNVSNTVIGTLLVAPGGPSLYVGSR